MRPERDGAVGDGRLQAANDVPLFGRRRIGILPDNAQIGRTHDQIGSAGLLAQVRLQEAGAIERVARLIIEADEGIVGEGGYYFAHRQKARGVARLLFRRPVRGHPLVDRTILGLPHGRLRGMRLAPPFGFRLQVGSKSTVGLLG